MRKIGTDGKQTSWNFYDNSKEWQKANDITRSDQRKFGGGIENIVLSMRDLQILLSFGREVELEYRGVTGFACSYWTSYNIRSEWDGNEQIYESEDLDDFAFHAVLGPYRLKDVIDQCRVTKLF